MALREFLDLGRQPLANNFLTKLPADGEHFYDLKVGLDEETQLVSLINQVNPELMFNKDYVYSSSGTETMREHFRRIAREIPVDSKDKSPTVLEIGSNDGVFLQHFTSNEAESIEPCSNFAKKTRAMGYTTIDSFWCDDLAIALEKQYEYIFSANCFCHIQDLDDAFKGIHRCLKDGGTFIMEDPDLSSILSRNSYDQIYDEHAHLFTYAAIARLCYKHGLEIKKTRSLDHIHGGSMRYYISKCSIPNKTQYGSNILSFEKLRVFAEKVYKSKTDLRKLLIAEKDAGAKIVSYGATSKSTTVFNFCDIGPEIIDYIVDTTPAKIGKYSPGMHIPVLSYEEGWTHDIDVAFLGAWNFEEEILENEMAWLENGGYFVTHVPMVRTLG